VSVGIIVVMATALSTAGPCDEDEDDDDDATVFAVTPNVGLKRRLCCGLHRRPGVGNAKLGTTTTTTTTSNTTNTTLCATKTAAALTKSRDCCFDDVVPPQLAAARTVVWWRWLNTGGGGGALPCGCCGCSFMVHNSAAVERYISGSERYTGLKISKGLKFEI
jgi:hypothetical protein